MRSGAQIGGFSLVTLDGDLAAGMRLSGVMATATSPPHQAVRVGKVHNNSERWRLAVVSVP